MPVLKWKSIPGEESAVSGEVLGIPRAGKMPALREQRAAPKEV